MWGVWISQNQAIFQDKSSSPKVTANKGLDILSYFPQTKDAPSVRIIIVEKVDYTMPWDFLDGASQNLACGGGATLHLTQNHHLQIQMGHGDGTNNYAKLLSLKLLLQFALEKGCRNLQIFRDSLIIINWVNKVHQCRTLTLSTLYEEVIRL